MSEAREIVWRAVRGVALEHCRIAARSAEGLIIGVDDLPFRARYTVGWDERWRTRSIDVQVEGGKALTLEGDGEGGWRTAEGNEVKALAGCLDVDISITPFTNTLPVRRLALAPLQAADLKVVYVTVPSLRVGLAKQRYTCLVRRGDGTMHRYESGAFKADIVLDADGLVIEYPRAFTRVWPR